MTWVTKVTWPDWGELADKGNRGDLVDHDDQGD